VVGVIIIALQSTKRVTLNEKMTAFDE